MTDREAFEKWLQSTGLLGDFALDVRQDGKYVLAHIDSQWSAWQACSAHYEAVMRRAVELSLIEGGLRNISCDGAAASELIDSVIKRAREEG